MDCQTGRVCIDLCGTWQILYDPEEKLTIDTIHSASGKKSTAVPSVFNVSEAGAKYTGVVWYQREVTIPPHQGLVELHLEGWYGKAEIYLDTTKLGERLYGYTPFSAYFSLQNAPHLQPHLLSIRIDNREQAGQTYKTPVFQQWGGLHRPIVLYLLPNIFIHSSQFRAEFDPTTIQDEKVNAGISCNVFILHAMKQAPTLDEIGLIAQIYDAEGKMTCPLGNISENPHQVKTTIEYVDLNTNKVHKFLGFAVRIEGKATFKVWSIDSPHLYKCRTTLENGDDYWFMVGIRQVGTNAQGQLLLNGCPVLFLGANRHDDHPEFGPAFVPQLLEFDLQVMKRAGFTGIRPAHYPTTEFFLNLCDQLGILVMEEVPVYIQTPEMMKDPVVLERGRVMLREMISAHYNHPSVIAWSVANECKSDRPESKAMLNTLCKIAQEIDPTRLVHFTGYPGLQNIAEIHATVVGINVYYGDSTSGQKLGPEMLGPVLDNLRDFMKDPEVGMANVPIFITEFGSQAVYGYHDISPYAPADGHSMAQVVYTEERQAAVIEQFFEQVKDRPFVAGMLVWLWRDTRYEPEIAQSAAGAVMRYGLLDWTGTPKLGFHALVRKIKELNEYRQKMK